MAVDKLQLGESEQVFRVVHILGGGLGGHPPLLPQEAGQLQLLQVMFQEQCGSLAHAALPDRSVIYSLADVVPTLTLGR